MMQAPSCSHCPSRQIFVHYQIITSEGATVASTVTYLLPVVAIVLGVLVLSESITVTTLAGIALVLGGVALTRRRVNSSNDEHLVE
jgi:drug/metabolite transporter (DMT)-like permease